MNLPMELYYKLINYGIYEPLHVIAIKDKSNLRPIFNCELNSNISGEIKINDDDDNLEALNQEWFMYLLMNQE
tara:strand:+ start:1841 stop:2059 length:219 start_codon:yes stop_codon:yes gene_type:complete